MINHHTYTPSLTGIRQRQQKVGEQHAAAQTVRVYSLIVPGLLQVPAYARAVFAPYRSSNEVDHHLDAAVQARTARQSILTAGSKSAKFLVPAAALYWPGRAAIMRPQFEHLIAVNAYPNVTVGIIPDGAANPGHGFTVLDTAEGPIVHVEAIGAGLTFNEEDAAPYQEQWNLLAEAALDENATLDYLHQRLNELDA